MYGLGSRACLLGMKSVLPVAFLGVLIISSAHGQDTTRVAARLHLTNVGFAPVPAFSFDSPVVFGFVTIKKKGFSFAPDAAVGLNGQPWMANNWFRFALTSANKWTVNLGVNPSLFFRRETTLSGAPALYARRNITVEGAVTKKFSRYTLQLSGSRVHAFDEKDGSGQFLDVSLSFYNTLIREKYFIEWKPQVFYFAFGGNIEGLFISSTARLRHATFPVSLYVQVVARVWASFPGDLIKWNGGCVFTF